MSVWLWQIKYIEEQMLLNQEPNQLVWIGWWFRGLKRPVKLKKPNQPKLFTYGLVRRPSYSRSHWSYCKSNKRHLCMSLFLNGTFLHRITFVYAHTHLIARSSIGLEPNVRTIGISLTNPFDKIFHLSNSGPKYSGTSSKAMPKQSWFGWCKESY